MPIKIDTTKLGKLDRIIPGCKVVSIPAGAAPKFVVVELPRADGARINAYYYGFPTLSVNDYVRIQRRGADNQYDVVGTDRGTASSASGVAPPDAQYVTLATDVTLTAERVLTAGTNIQIADGGAGNAVTVDTTDVLQVTETTTPATPATGDWKLYFKAGGLYYLDDNGNEIGPLTSNAGFTHTYLGYNTVGGSSVAMAQYRTYMKQITVSTAGLLTDIAIHVGHSAATNLQNLMAYVLSDNAGAPHLQISLGARTGSVSDGTFFMTTTARWLSIPIGLYLPAGDYWLCVQRMDDPGTDLMLYYDGSGADKYQDIAGGWSADGSQYTITNTTNKYSIRASLIY